MIEVIEEIILSDDVHEILSEWINSGVVHYGNENTSEWTLNTSLYCDVWRDCYGSQPVDTAKISIESGLV